MSDQIPIWPDARIDEVEPRTATKAWLMKVIRDDERKPLLARIAELERTIAYIDAHAPRADSTCDEPGITLSQAARREMRDAT